MKEGGGEVSATRGVYKNTWMYGLEIHLLCSLESQTDKIIHGKS